VTPAWLRDCADGVRLSLYIQPGAKKTEIAGEHGEALKIRLAAPPVDGRANEALLAFLAGRLGVARAKLSLEAGASSRRKRVHVDGLACAAVLAQLSPPQSP
jgi:hypothetical protein